MKAFQTLISETLEAQDLEELEAAADLFQFGVEKGHYTKRQADEFNNVYWRVKDKHLTNTVSQEVKANYLDILSIISKAPTEIKDSKYELVNYVNGRLKALKGKISGLK